MNYIYIQTEKKGHNFCVVDLWTVGFYDPSGEFIPESDHSTIDEAVKRVVYLNGGGKGLDYNLKPFKHEHTSGNWYWRKTKHKKDYLIQGEREIIAFVKPFSREGSVRDGNKAEQKANAKLISNAPKLLEIAGRMVKNGLLERVKRGVYKLGKPKKKTQTQIENKNQYKLEL